LRIISIEFSIDFTIFAMSCVTSALLFLEMTVTKKYLDSSYLTVIVTIVEAVMVLFAASDAVTVKL